MGLLSKVLNVGPEEVSISLNVQRPMKGYIDHNQENMTPSKEANKGLIVNPKDMKIHELLDK